MESDPKAVLHCALFTTWHPGIATRVSRLQEDALGSPHLAGVFSKHHFRDAKGLIELISYLQESKAAKDGRDEVR
jgi:hypothetical protein